MSIYTIRHGFSAANNRDNIGTLAFAAKQAPLEESGRKQARTRATTLFTDFGIVPAETPAAISELLRTEQTAKEMGFCALRRYELLNEVEHDMERADFYALLGSGKLPITALRTAEAILNQPPEEQVWLRTVW